MADDPQPPRPVRAWPPLALTAVYWAFQLIIARSDMAMFPLFLSKALGNLAFLLVFLVLWLSNGTLTGRVRLLGLGVFLGGIALGIAAAHRSFDPMGFLMTAVPMVLTFWAGWLLLRRARGGSLPAATLAAAILLPVVHADLIRWEGLDGRLRPTHSWRWAVSEEQKFLASKPLLQTAGTPAAAWTLKPGDWPEFRGALRDGAARGVRIAADWKEAPPQLVWKERVGPGWSSIIVVDRFLVTQEQRGDSEAVVCYDAETGQELWSHRNAARFEEGIAGPGPRATPTFREGRIYSLGAKGHLACLEAATGKPVWSKELAPEAPAPQWGCSASPLIADGKIVVFVGGSSAKGVLAFDAATGAPAWSREGGKESYSSAQLVALRGKAQIVMQDNRRMAGLSVSDGAVLWERPGEGESIIPMIQPHPLEDGSLLVSSGQDLALLDLQENGGKWNVTEKWTTKRFKPTFNDIVVHGGHAFGLDGGFLSCVDLRNGERVWKKGRYGSGQLLLLADQGLLLVLSETGELALVDARPQEPGEAFRFQALEGKTWNHPALAGDRVYVRNATEMACYRLRALKTP